MTKSLTDKPSAGGLSGICGQSARPQLLCCWKCFFDLLSVFTKQFARVSNYSSVHWIIGGRTTWVILFDPHLALLGLLGLRLNLHLISSCPGLQTAVDHGHFPWRAQPFARLPLWALNFLLLCLPSPSAHWGLVHLVPLALETRLINSLTSFILFL